ncbi:calcitonin/calcitonin-related polypeptide, alpha isoform X2 [Takifugu rubripes]|uniref:Calcitonin related polypeptide beta n=1 Tax=Takifugu rubripes TaxID=31033 RepID=H2V548_TAKRU|nr:calcitonin gene-related peptide isoform X2 [Takifugu rubripes]
MELVLKPRRFVYKTLACVQRSAEPQVRISATLQDQDIHPPAGTNVMLKAGTLLLAYALLVCPMYFSQAAPSRTSKESVSDGVSLSSDDAQRLFNAVKELLQIPSDEDPQTADGDGNTTVQKRACKTATCVTHRLADFLSRSGGLGYSNFVPTNVGAQAFGRRKRQSPV